MKGTCFLVKSGYWQQSLFLFAVFLSLQMSGCQGNSYTNNLLDAKNLTTTTSPETTNHSFSRYHSDTLPEDCFFCGDGEKTFPFLLENRCEVYRPLPVSMLNEFVCINQVYVL